MAGPFAGAALLAALGGARGIAMSAAGSALPYALGALFDNNESFAGKTGEVLGAGLGGVPGAFGGAMAGSMLGGSKYGRYLRGPGAIVGGLAGAGFGASAGGSLTRQLAGENQPPLQQAAEQQMRIERQRMPLTRDQAQMATALEMDRMRQIAELDRRRNEQDAAMQMMLNGQQNSAALQQQMIASILGSGGLV